MTTVLQAQGALASGGSIGPFTSGFACLCNSWFGIGNITSSPGASITYRVTGTISHLCLNVDNNSLDAATDLTVYQNGGATALTISVPAGTSGYFDNTTDTVAVASGDVIYIFISVPATAGTALPACISTLFTPSGANVAQIVSGSTRSVGQSTASATNYIPLGGHFDALNTTENRAQQYVGYAGTFSKFYITSSLNTRATTSTARLRKNGANGNLVISITPGVSGIYEDLVNSDSFVAGDLGNFSTTLGTGIGNLNIQQWAVLYENSTNNGLILFGRPGAGFAPTSNVSRWVSVGGGTTVYSTESPVQTKALIDFTASKMSLFVSANTISFNASTLWLNVNAVTTALTVSIGAGATGRFSDITNTVAVVATDLLSYLFIGGAGGGTMTCRTISMSGEFPPTPSGLSSTVLKCGVVIGF